MDPRHRIISNHISLAANYDAGPKLMGSLPRAYRTNVCFCRARTILLLLYVFGCQVTKEKTSLHHHPEHSVAHVCSLYRVHGPFQK